MNHTELARLVSKLRFKIQPRHRNMKTIKGPEHRLFKIGQTVTGLIKYERIELGWIAADEARGYAERLISDAIRHGDQHGPTMEMANYYIHEKQYIHKLFKVLVPRFRDMPLSYTRMYKAPPEYPKYGSRPCALLELRGNPFPPVKPDMSMNRNMIHNVLLHHAKIEYRREKYERATAESTVNEQAEKSAEDEISEQLEKTKIADSAEKKE